MSSKPVFNVSLIFQMCINIFTTGRQKYTCVTQIPGGDFMFIYIPVPSREVTKWSSVTSLFGGGVVLVETSNMDGL